MYELNTQFYALISEIMKLETEYAKGQDRYKHLEYLFYSVGKNNQSKMYVAKHECDTKISRINELTEKLKHFDMDSTMKTYYDLYKEKSELLKQYWKCETEMGKIDSRFIFDCICDEEIDNELAEKRKQIENKQMFLDKQIETITSRMKLIYDALQLKAHA